MGGCGARQWRPSFAINEEYVPDSPRRLTFYGIDFNSVLLPLPDVEDRQNRRAREEERHVSELFACQSLASHKELDGGLTWTDAAA